MWCSATSRIKCWKTRPRVGMPWAGALGRPALCTVATLVPHRWVETNSQPFGASPGRERQFSVTQQRCAMHVAPS